MSDTRPLLDELGESVKTRFQAQKRVLSYDDYLNEVVSHPFRHSRDAARYLRDCFDYFGVEEVPRPGGTVRRFKLFDQRFVDGESPDVRDEQARTPPSRARLVGHEALQNEFYRALQNFVREGRTNRLLLMHGPNGSAKSTFAACLMRALERYSGTDEGALYRFSWVFARGAEERSIGFGSAGRRGRAGESLAHLEADKVEAKLVSELREHPLLLLPLEERRALIERIYTEADIDDAPPEWLWHGRLGRKNAEVFDALLASYGGDLRRVLAHVQVERFYISRRYRTGAVTIGPQMAVDAGERQITADRSVAALPAALTSLSLYETQGELVDGSAGLIEYSDLLKRPLEAWKYLLLAIESGEVALSVSVLTLNSVLLASTNEGHLEAFRQHPEYDSFRARLSMLQVGYLVDYRQEQQIYDAQIVPQLRCHVAPHGIEMAALWAVLTRMLPAQVDHYESPALGKVAADLTPMEKARLYADGDIPRRLDSEQAKVLRSGLGEVVSELEGRSEYEGSVGASPREIRTVVLDAAQDPHHPCLSPQSVLTRLSELCARGDYEFLKHAPQDGFLDAGAFIVQVRKHWIELFDREVRASTGLVEESRYRELFERYISHISTWVKKERLLDPVTGKYVEPDEGLMGRVESALDVAESDAEEFRRNLINSVAAYAIDHPGDSIDHDLIFPRQLEQVRESYFAEHRTQVVAILDDMLALLSDGDKRVSEEGRAAAEAALEHLYTIGYCKHCARSSLGELREERYL
ncbi:MAG: serine protein kinase PrkA [Myxococcales bacterium]|nr:serine protein kinase PrkA [Myxococcales bacterium]